MCVAAARLHHQYKDFGLVASPRWLSGVWVSPAGLLSWCLLPVPSNACWVDGRSSGFARFPLTFIALRAVRKARARAHTCLCSTGSFAGAARASRAAGFACAGLVASTLGASSCLRRFCAGTVSS